MWRVIHLMSYKDGIWTCPECGRQVQAVPIKVIVKGDITATHQGAAGGFRWTGVKVVKG